MVDDFTIIMRAREIAEHRKAWFDGYNEYLKSKAWGLKRAAVLARAKGLCEECRERPAIQAHHLTYRHWGYERLDELVAVCLECHAEFHKHGR